MCLKLPTDIKLLYRLLEATQTAHKGILERQYRESSTVSFAAESVAMHELKPYLSTVELTRPTELVLKGGRPDCVQAVAAGVMSSLASRIQQRIHQVTEDAPPYRKSISPRSGLASCSGISTACATANDRNQRDV